MSPLSIVGRHVGHWGDHLPAPLWNLPVQPLHSDSPVHLHKEGRVRIQLGAMGRCLGRAQGDDCFAVVFWTPRLSEREREPWLDIADGGRVACLFSRSPILLRHCRGVTLEGDDGDGDGDDSASSRIVTLDDDDFWMTVTSP